MTCFSSGCLQLNGTVWMPPAIFPKRDSSRSMSSLAMKGGTFEIVTRLILRLPQFLSQSVDLPGMFLLQTRRRPCSSETPTLCLRIPLTRLRPLAPAPPSPRDSPHTAPRGGVRRAGHRRSAAPPSQPHGAHCPKPELILIYLLVVCLFIDFIICLFYFSLF